MMVTMKMKKAHIFPIDSSLKIEQRGAGVEARVVVGEGLNQVVIRRDNVFVKISNGGGIPPEICENEEGRP